VNRPVVALLAASSLCCWGQSILQVRVVQGEGAVYAIGSRATRGVVVQVTDETGKPVTGAAVSFRLPEDGPSGEFRAGGRTEIVTTGADGKAEVWGMLWNGQTGPLDLRVIAVVKRSDGDTRGSVICPLYLSNAAVLSSSTEPPVPGHKIGHSRKKLWIALGIAAAAGVAVAGVSGSKSVPAPAAIGVTQPNIGPPTVTITRP
jgi:hypothetical protein